MKKRDKLMRYFLYFFLIGIGLVVGISIRNFHNIPIAEAINIIDLATLVATIFLAVYIPEVLDRKLQSQRDKKEMLEKRIDEFQSLLRKVNSIVQSDEVTNLRGYYIVQNTVSVALHKFEIIARLLKSAGLADNFERDTRMILRLCGEHVELLAADGEIDKDFAYTEDVQKREEELFNRIDEAASMLIFKISEAD